MMTMTRLCINYANEKYNMRSHVDRAVLKYLTFHPQLYDQQLISHLTGLQYNPPPPASLIDQMDI